MSFPSLASESLGSVRWGSPSTRRLYRTTRAAVSRQTLGKKERKNDERDVATMMGTVTMMVRSRRACGDNGAMVVGKQVSAGRRPCSWFLNAHRTSDCGILYINERTYNKRMTTGSQNPESINTNPKNQKASKKNINQKE